jgi:hypothetical protein
MTRHRRGDYGVAVGSVKLAEFDVGCPSTIEGRDELAEAGTVSGRGHYEEEAQRAAMGEHGSEGLSTRGGGQLVHAVLHLSHLPACRAVGMVVNDDALTSVHVYAATSDTLANFSGSSDISVGA